MRPGTDEARHRQLTVLAGWRRFVDEEPVPPELLPDRQWRRLSDAGRLAYDEARLNHHSGPRGLQRYRPLRSRPHNWLMRLDERIVIARDIGDLWAFFMDIQNLPKWDRSVARVQAASDNGGVG
ncbi:MAG TPA: hypothetical protein VHZ03_29875 [Trebonia sp.]|jgi:hypothetical protein|nr:hypothetical protein [Trebonia sp.]